MARRLWNSPEPVDCNPASRHESPLRCGADALAIALIPAALYIAINILPSTANPYIGFYEELQVDCLAALNAASSVRQAGRIYHAYTGWDVRWDLRWDTSAAGLCGITSVATRLVVKMTLPEMRTGTPADLAAFRKYAAALLRHEEGHRRIARDAADTADRTIMSLPPMANCQALEQEANRQGTAIIEHAKRIEIDYDIATGSGCTQGACLAQ